MRERLRRLLDFGQTVQIEFSEIVHETESGILVEYNRQNAWLPKKKIKIQRNDKSVVVNIPRWLFRQKW